MKRADGAVLPPRSLFVGFCLAKLVKRSIKYPISSCVSSLVSPYLKKILLDFWFLRSNRTVVPAAQGRWLQIHQQIFVGIEQEVHVFPNRFVRNQTEITGK